jgi:hypothetical protein
VMEDTRYEDNSTILFLWRWFRYLETARFWL